MLGKKKKSITSPTPSDYSWRLLAYLSLLNKCPTFSLWYNVTQSRTCQFLSYTSSFVYVSLGSPQDISLEVFAFPRTNQHSKVYHEAQEYIQLAVGTVLGKPGALIEISNSKTYQTMATYYDALTRSFVLERMCSWGAVAKYQQEVKYGSNIHENDHDETPQERCLDVTPQQCRPAEGTILVTLNSWRQRSARMDVGSLCIASGWAYEQVPHDPADWQRCADLDENMLDLVVARFPIARWL